MSEEAPACGADGAELKKCRLRMLFTATQYRLWQKLPIGVREERVYEEFGIKNPVITITGASVRTHEGDQVLRDRDWVIYSAGSPHKVVTDDEFRAQYEEV